MSVHRRYFEESGKLKDTHRPYPDAMRQLAEEENVPLSDLAEKTRRLLEESGPEVFEHVSEISASNASRLWFGTPLAGCRIPWYSGDGF